LNPLVLSKPLSFEIVIFNAKGKIIRRELKQAQYEIEDLGNGVILEMVSIPRGTFMMGSPETEEKRDDDEGPSTPCHHSTLLDEQIPRHPAPMASNDG
jgi:formylglycine-generating enzyme required for sulfatase activity